MSLYDRENPMHLTHLARHRRRMSPGCALPAADYCQRCDQPHDWCECGKVAS